MCYNGNENPMDHLEKVTSIVVTTNNLIAKVAIILEKYYNNIIFINKPGLLFKYTSVSVFINNNEFYIDFDSNKEDIKKINQLINKADRVRITPIDEKAVLDYDKKSIEALGGLNLLCFKELALEFFKTMIYNIMYADSELLYLCRNNPGINDVTDTINVLELLDVYPSPYITENELSDLISIISKELSDEYTMYIKNIRSACIGYTKNPKAIKVTSRCIVIDIYSDIRVLRFYEATEHMKTISQSKKEEIYDETICDSGYN